MCVLRPRFSIDYLTEPEATETRRIAQASQGQEGEPEEIPEYTLEEEVGVCV